MIFQSAPRRFGGTAPRASVGQGPGAPALAGHPGMAIISTIKNQRFSLPRGEFSAAPRLCQTATVITW